MGSDSARGAPEAEPGVGVEAADTAAEPGVEVDAVDTALGAER